MREQRVDVPAGQHGRAGERLGLELGEPGVHRPALLDQGLARRPSVRATHLDRSVSTRSRLLDSAQGTYPAHGRRRPVRTITAVMRIETAQGALARRGFTDAAARRAPPRLLVAAPAPAARHDRPGRRPGPRARHPRPAERRRPRPARPPGRRPACSRRTSSPSLGASLALGQHLVVAPGAGRGARRPADAGRRRPTSGRSCCGPSARTRRPTVPVAEDLVGDGLRLAYRGRAAAGRRPRPVRARADRGRRRGRRRALRPGRRHARGGAVDRPGQGRARRRRRPGSPWSRSARRGRRS